MPLTLAFSSFKRTVIASSLHRKWHWILQINAYRSNNGETKCRCLSDRAFVAAKPLRVHGSSKQTTMTQWKNRYVVNRYPTIYPAVNPEMFLLSSLEFGANPCQSVSMVLYYIALDILWSQPISLQTRRGSVHPRNWSDLASSSRDSAAASMNNFMLTSASTKRFWRKSSSHVPWCPMSMATENHHSAEALVWLQHKHQRGRVSLKTECRPSNIAACIVDLWNCRSLLWKFLVVLDFCLDSAKQSRSIKDWWTLFSYIKALTLWGIRSETPKRQMEVAAASLTCNCFRWV